MQALQLRTARRRTIVAMVIALFVAIAASPAVAEKPKVLEIDKKWVSPPRRKDLLGSAMLGGKRTVFVKYTGVDLRLVSKFVDGGITNLGRSFWLRATPASAGRQFEIPVSYNVEKYQAVRRRRGFYWRKMSSETQIAKLEVVIEPELPRLFGNAGGPGLRVPLPGNARLSDIDDSSTATFEPVTRGIRVVFKKATGLKSESLKLSIGTYEGRARARYRCVDEPIAIDVAVADEGTVVDVGRFRGVFDLAAREIIGVDGVDDVSIVTAVLQQGKIGITRLAPGMTMAYVTVAGTRKGEECLVQFRVRIVGSLVAAPRVTPESIVAALRQHYLDGVPLDIVCKDFNVDEATFKEWARTLFDRADEIFRNPKGAPK